MANPMIGGSENVLEDGLSQQEGINDDYNAELDPGNDAYWLSRARSSYVSSTDWFDSSVRRKMEDNMRLFNSDHPRGSRYTDELYQKRSRLFRPKTRSGIRKLEAACAAAFFATQDAVATTPPNPRDRQQRLASEVNGELLNYRLQNSIPWFMTCVGAIQDAAKQGVVISKQEWVYREVQEEYEEEEIDVMSGEVVGTHTVYETRTVKDHPDIRLCPVENIRFSPAADWRNPLQSSPYLIELEPWFIGDILERMEKGPEKTGYDVGWRKMTKAQIRSTMKQSYDPVRQAREGSREDRYDDPSTAIQEHEVVWVHHNYTRIDGEDWYYCTLGTELVLSDPIPLSEVSPLDERPYVMGYASLETHKPYPASLVELGRPLQEEINDVTNLRLDNIRHVISPRYFIKRGTSIDVRSLLRNIAGGVTAMEDPKNDVNIRQIADVTGSSYMEQDRLSVEFDELTGNFSQSSVASNHNITERVGNTQMMGESANQITEMTIRVFAETWVEPALQQIMKLEQALETDPVVLAIVGQRNGLHPEVAFRMLNFPVKVNVNVGFGATNPQRRLQKVMSAFQALAAMNPEWIREADKSEVISEVLGAVGFKSADRFFPGIGNQDQQEDPRIQQYQQEIEQLRAMLDGKGQELEFKGQLEQAKIQSKERIEMAKLQHTQQKDMSAQELAYAIEKQKWQSKMLDYQISREQNEFRRQELVQQRIALNHTITMDERQYAMMKQQQEMQAFEEPEERESINEETGEATDKAEAKAAENGNKIPKVDVEPKNPTPTDRPEGAGRRIANTPKLGGNDKAGVIARGKYGGIPFKEG